MPCRAGGGERSTLSSPEPESSPASPASPAPPSPPPPPSVERPGWFAKGTGWLAAPAGPDRWFTLALALTSLILATPLLLHPYLPLLDVPQHVGAVAILAGGDPALAYERYYTTDLLSSPYLLPYLVSAALAQLIGAKAAVHLLFAVAAGAWPWAVASALGGLGRDRCAALILAPLAYGTFVFLGFLNFALSLPLYLVWLGYAARIADAGRLRPRDAGIGVLLGLLLYSGHVMTLAFAIGTAGLLVLFGTIDGAHGGRAGVVRRARRMLTLVPGALAFAVWALTSETAQKGELGRMIGGSLAQEAMRWDPMLDRPKVLLDHMLACYQGNQDERLLYALLAGVALLALARHASEPPVPARPAAPRALTLALWIAAIACALLLPASYRGIWPIAARMAPFVLMLAVLVPTTRLLLPRLWLLVGLGLAIASVDVHERHFRAFDEEVGPLDDVLDQLPPGPRLMTLVFDRGSQVVAWPPYLHVSQYAVARRGGVAEFSFVNFTKSPIHYVEAEAPPRLPARFEWTPERYDHAAHGSYYTHVLVRGSAQKAEALWQGRGPPMRVVHRAGRWTLYARADLDATAP